MKRFLPFLLALFVPIVAAQNTLSTTNTPGPITGEKDFGPSKLCVLKSVSGKACLTFTGSGNSTIDLSTLFSGAYADLTGKPTLFDGAYASLSGKPTLGTLAALNAAPAGTLTGTTLAAGVTASSLLSAAGGSFGSAAYTAATAYATSAQGALADAALPAASVATDADIFGTRTATVTGSGSAYVGLSSTAGGTLGDADSSIYATAVQGYAIAPLIAYTEDGNADVSGTATTDTGNASANASATATTGNASTNRTAQTATGNADGTNNAFATDGNADAGNFAGTTIGTATSGHNSSAGAHQSGVSASANDAAGATLEINTGDDVGTTGQLLGNVDGKAKWLPAANAAGVLTNNGSGGLTWETAGASGITALTGDVTASGSGSVAASIGSTKVTSAMLNADVYSTAHSWGGTQTFTAPVLGTPASGVATNLTGTAASLTAGHVTTNANLTGPITSSGNATSVAAQTGTGSTFVMAASPTLTTPNLGTPSAAVLTNATGLPAAALTAITGGQVATASVPGFLSAADWSTFNSKGAGTVTSIATTSPISGGTITGTGTISLLVNVDHAFTAAQTITPASGATALTLAGGALVLSGNISQAAWTTNGARIKGVAATLTDTSSSGTVAAAYTDVLGGNTIAASSATTYTDYYTAFFKDPVQGTNATFTNKWSLGLEGRLKAAGINLGVAGSTVGTIVFSNATSGTATLQPPTGALGAITYTLPGVTSTLATLGANTFTGNQTVGNSVLGAGSLVIGSTGFVQAGSGGVFLNSGSNYVGLSSFGNKAVGLLSDWFVGWKSATTGDGTATGWDTAVGRNAAGVVEINSSVAGTFRDLKLRNIVGQTGYHEFTEMTAPGGGATNNARVYAEDNGSGKTRLMVIFPTGSAVQLAIEP